LDGTYALGILPGEVEAQPEAPGLLRQFPCARFIDAGFRFAALVDIALRISDREKRWNYIGSPP